MLSSRAILPQVSQESKIRSQKWRSVHKADNKFCYFSNIFSVSYLYLVSFYLQKQHTTGELQQSHGDDASLTSTFRILNYMKT